MLKFDHFVNGGEERRDLILHACELSAQKAVDRCKDSFVHSFAKEMSRMLNEVGSTRQHYQQVADLLVEYDEDPDNFDGIFAAFYEVRN